MTVSYCKQHPEADPNHVAQHYAFNIAQNLVHEYKRGAFNQEFAPTTPLTTTENKTDKQFVVTESRRPVRQLLDDLLNLRSLRQQNRSQGEAQLYGGLWGIILDGEPGIGKSELVFATLREHGLKPPKFYTIPVSMPLPEKEALLLKAFNEGAVVVIDEINASPMMERLLNDLLMGKSPDGKRPGNPGFMVMSTQNPVTMAGRRAPSTALSRRLITAELPSYSEHEMRHILSAKGLNQEQT
ncbi:MAG: hypothetical protein ACRCXC_05555 [Legionella sp.]